jgi:hypothetical protein
VQERRKHEEERCELSLQLTLAEAKVQQMQALQAELVTAREECASLLVCIIHDSQYLRSSCWMTVLTHAAGYEQGP